jgi:hypothetical protein
MAKKKRASGSKGKSGAKEKRHTNVKGKGATRRVVVTVDDEHMSKVHDVAGRLRTSGMSVDNVMEATGMISGAASVETSAIKKIKGVASVEDEPSFQLPPPDSAVQ